MIRLYPTPDSISNNVEQNSFGPASNITTGTFREVAAYNMGIGAMAGFRSKAQHSELYLTLE